MAVKIECVVDATEFDATVRVGENSRLLRGSYSALTKLSR